MRKTEVLGFRMDVLGGAEAAQAVSEWARAGESRVVLAANVHMVMEAWDDQRLRQQLAEADLAVADGMPLVWALRALGHRTAEHVRGTDLALEACRRAQEAGIPIGLYGSAPETLRLLRAFLEREFPKLSVTFAVSPPFRELTHLEDLELVQKIRASGARILLVGLGCPKQERWMLEHRGRLPCVMLGVGAAFDFLSGTVAQAPLWVQRVGFEWLYRLGSDPRRLWRRYLKHNPRFVILFGRQWLRVRILGSVGSRL